MQWQRSATVLALRLAFLMLALASSHAHPAFYLDEYAEGCLSHPETGFSRRYHGGALTRAAEDPEIAFTVTGAGKKAAVTKICPGASYDVYVSFPEAREALLTASEGAFVTAPQGAVCPNRVIIEEHGETEEPWEVGTLKVR